MKPPRDMTSDEVMAIGLMTDDSGGDVICRHVRRVIDRKRERLEDAPKINTEDVSKDFRYQLGYIAALRDILKDVDQAKKAWRTTPRS